MKIALSTHSALRVNKHVRASLTATIRRLSLRLCLLIPFTQPEPLRHFFTKQACVRFFSLPVTGDLGVTPPQDTQTLHPDGLKCAEYPKKKSFPYASFFSFFPAVNWMDVSTSDGEDADRRREKLLKRSRQTTAHADPHARQRSSRTHPKHLRLTTHEKTKK